MGVVTRKNRGRLGAPVQPAVQPHSIPASVGGVNALSPLMGMPIEDCIYTFNLMPVEYGLRLRKGYREWATGVEGDVRSIIPYESPSSDPADDRLFAVSEYGIYDVSLFNTTSPDKVVDFIQQGEAAGNGVHCEFTSISGDHYLYYADELNGIWVYENETQLWERPQGWVYDDPNDPETEIPFPVENVAFVMVHKLRIWVVLEDSTDAYYLDVASISGKLTLFTFGAKMIHGGNLMGLWTWTLDGGDGVDDYLTAISRGGDMMIYRGSDPIAEDWQLTGTWFLGEVPRSRRIVSQHGGDMYALSTFGLTSFRDLLQGSAADLLVTSPSAKVARFLRADVQSGVNSYRWSLRVNPGDGSMYIITPKPSNTQYIQYSQNLSTKAWGFMRDVPMLCGYSWNGEFFFGSTNGIVYVYDGVLDGTQLPKENIWDGTLAAPLPPEWTIPVAGEYACDGTQLADTSVDFTATDFAVTGIQYILEYKVKDSQSGSHWIEFAGNDTARATGDGNYRYILTNFSGAGQLIRILGDTSFEGTIYDIGVSIAPKIGDAVKFNLLTSFTPPGGQHASYKIPGFIRTIGVLAGTASINVNAVFDYKIATQIEPPVTIPTQGTNVWDSAIWDQSFWDFELDGRSFPFGTLGIGRTLAIGMAGSATTRINVVGWDVMFQEGGLL